jgi:hypothetical protein
LLWAPEEHGVDCVGRELGDRCRVVGLVDGVPVGIELRGQEGALVVVGGCDQQRVLLRLVVVLRQ